MSDQQPASWRERFFGTKPAEELAPERDVPADGNESTDDVVLEHDSAELEPDSAEVASATTDEHDDYRPLVEHSDEGASADAADGPEAADAVDSPIEPTVIAPSSLRGPSHSASHPDDVRSASATDSAYESSLEVSYEDEPAENGTSVTEADAAGADATQFGGGESGATDAAVAEPPALVEPQRPSFGLRRSTEAEPEVTDASAETAALPTSAGDAYGADSNDASTSTDDASLAEGSGDAEFVEPEAATLASTTADQDAQSTQAYSALDIENAESTRVLETQPGQTDAQSTERFGVIRDEVPASAVIPVDEATARATAQGGTPIVLVEEPMPPRRKGARGVGFAVTLLATVIFAGVFAAAFFAVGYLFDRAFDANATLQTVWLRPSFLLPVIVFFIAYWLLTLLVNRAGWWAHVLGGFIVALFVYLAHIGGAFMEQRGGWEAYTAIPGIDPAALSQLLLAPLSVLAFVVAREVPIWVGGIVARRGRKAREYNRKALEDFNAENAERLAAYELARG